MATTATVSGDRRGRGFRVSSTHAAKTLRGTAVVRSELPAATSALRGPFEVLLSTPIALQFYKGTMNILHNSYLENKIFIAPL